MTGSVAGAVLAVIAALCYGTSNVCYSRLKGLPLPHVLTGILVWNVLFLAVALLFRDGGFRAVGAAPVSALVLFGVVGLLSSLLGRIGLLIAIGRLGPSRASTIKNAAPIVSLGLGLALFGQVPSLWGVLGVLTILTGIVLLTLDRARTTPAPLAVPTVGAVPLTVAPDPSLRAPQSGWSADMRIGLITALLVAVMFALSDSVRLVALDDLSDPLLGTLVGGGISLVVAAGWLWGSRSKPSDPGIRMFWDPWIVGAGLASSMGLLANFSAVSHMFVGYVTAVVALAPVTTALIGKVLSPGRETFGPATRVSMLLVVVGTAAIATVG